MVFIEQIVGDIVLCVLMVFMCYCIWYLRGTVCMLMIFSIYMTVVLYVSDAT